MNTPKIRRKTGFVLSLLLALYILLTLKMTVSPVQAGEELSLMTALKNAISSFTLATPVLYVFLAALCRFAVFIPSKNDLPPVYIVVSSLFLTFCMLLGRAFIDPDWAHLVIRLDKRCIVKWLFCLPGWYALCHSAVKLLFLFLDTISAPKALSAVHPRSRLLRAYEAHPFAASLLIFLVCFAPVTFLSMPGLVEAGDTVGQICQFYGLPTGYWGNLLYAESTITNHHPVAHSFLLHLFLELGLRAFSSAQIGLGIFTCLQVLFTCTALAFVLSQLHKEGAPALACILSALFIGLHPRVQNLIVMVSKDMLYSAFLLIFAAALLRTLKKRRWGLPLLAATSLGCMLMRNEGIYILLGAFAAMFLLHRNTRKQSLLMLAFCAAAWTCWTNVAFPALHISPGSQREMFSIPFQQTGRVIARQGEKVTAEERAIIDGVLIYDDIAGMYRPNLSDGVKNLYRREADSEDLAAYLKTWFSMFFKYPMVYLEAFLDDKNLLLYPTPSIVGAESTVKTYEVSAMDLKVISEDCESVGIRLSYPEALAPLRTAYEQTRETLFSLPGLRLFTQFAPIVWASLLLALYALARKRTLTLIFLVPALLQVLVIFAGPTDGWLFRYIYPVLLYLPVCLLFALYIDPARSKPNA